MNARPAPAHPAPLPAVFSVAEAASALSVSPVTVRRMVARGDLDAIRLGYRDGSTVRIPVASIRRLLAPPTEEGVERR